MNTPHRSRPSLRLAVALALAPSLTHAADRFWIDGLGGPFATTTNWSATDGGAGGASVPGVADIANFTLNNTYTVNFASAVTNTDLDVENGNITFDLGGFTYSLTSGNGISIGNVAGQTGRLTVREGVLGVDTNGDSVTIGALAGSTGFLTVTTDGQLGTVALRPDIFVGSIVNSSGTGTLTVNDNGRVDGGGLTVGSVGGSTGTATITGPNAVVSLNSSATIGFMGTGTLTVSNGGTLSNSQTSTLGSSLGADGTVTVTGIGSSWTMGFTLIIGNSGDGALTISSGGLVDTPNTVVLGSSATGFGTATVTGANSRWSLLSAQTIGSSGLGVMTVSSGGQVASIALAGAVLGGNAGGEGRVTVAGAGSQWTLNNSITVGSAGTGDLTVSAGGEVSAVGVVLASQASGFGVVTVTGAGSKLTSVGDNLTVGGNGGGGGTLNVASSGEVYVGQDLVLRDPAGPPIGMLNLDGGSIFVARDLINNGVLSFTDGLLQVARNFQPNATALPLTINGADNGNLPTVDLIGTGTMTNVTSLTVGNNRRGQLLVRQGRVLDAATNSVAIGALVGGEGTVTVSGGAHLIGINTLAVGGALSTAGGTGTLNVAGGTVDAVTLRIFNGGAINLSSGTLAVDTIPVLDGPFNWTGGTLRFDTNFDLTSTNVPKLLGLDATLNAGQTLASTSPVTLLTAVVVDGGALNPNNLINQSTLEIRSGSVAVNSTTTNSAGGHIFVERNLSVGGTLTNASGARLTLAGGTGRLLGGGSLQNSGLVTGDGTITNGVTNNAAGKIRVDAGKTLLFTGAFAPNAGELQLQGGTLDFTGAITNGATGFIAGRGALYTAGITNSGQMAFSGGTTDIHGDVTNAAGGRIVTSGAGTTTFFDDVIHNGTEIRTSAGGASVFFGAVSGAGPYTGTGTVYFEGDLRPGNSPASVLYEGDLVLGGSATLTLELGGLLLGGQYDHLNVGGTFTADGALDVLLYDGFMPHIGDTFDLFDAGALAGNFDDINLPSLSGNLAWDDSQLSTTGQLRVVPEPGLGALLASALSILGLRRSRSKNNAVILSENHRRPRARDRRAARCATSPLDTLR